MSGPLNSDKEGEELTGYYLAEVTVTCNTGYVVEGIPGDLTSYQTTCLHTDVWSITHACERKLNI